MTTDTAQAVDAARAVWQLARDAVTAFPSFTEEAVLTDYLGQASCGNSRSRDVVSVVHA